MAETKEKKEKNYKKTYLYLWILLAVGLAVAVAISLMHDPEFFGVSVKQGTFQEVLLAEEEGSAADSLNGDMNVAGGTLAADGTVVAPGQKASPAATSGEAAGVSENNAAAPGSQAAPAAAPATPPPAGKTAPYTGANTVVNYPQSGGAVRNILIFGDSMTILVANRLAQYGAKNGFNVTSITWDSSSTVTWSKCDTLDNFISRNRPDLVMIVLGSNELFLKDYNVRKPNIQQLLAKIGNIPYLWISPPNWKEDKGYNSFMTSVLAPGTFYNSNDLDLPRQKDHIHPTMKGGETWTDSIMKWVPKSAHPFSAQVPDPGTSSSHDMHYYRARR